MSSYTALTAQMYDGSHIFVTNSAAERYKLHLYVRTLAFVCKPGF